MLPDAGDIERLCAVWLKPADSSAGVAESCRRAVRALLELSGGSGLCVATSQGLFAAGDLDAAGAGELIDGRDGVELHATAGLLVRARDASSGATALFRTALRSDRPDALLDSCAALARAVGAFSRRDERQFGEWELLGIVAEGGMARVYLARSRNDPSRLVALKRIRPHLAKDPEYLSLFSREVQAATSISHDHVVRFIEYGVAESEVYLAMEYLHGLSLAELTRRARAANLSVPNPLLLAVAQQYCAGLHAIHRAGMIHCDVSPQNLFLTVEGVGKVVDFGLARARNRTEREPVRGKRAYIAPEQLLGEAVDQRADVYGLGAVAYELLSGLSPEAFEEKVKRGLPPLRTLAPDLPLAVEDAVMGALAPDPAARLLSARALGRALEDAAQGFGVEALSPTEIARWVKDFMVDRDVALKALMSPHRPKGDETKKLG